MGRLVAVGVMVIMTWLPALAQVITPMELQDPKLQRLQQRHTQTLMAIGSEIEHHKFPYPLYLSRTLDVDIAKVPAADLRSIRFDFCQRRTVLAVSGNYYASYSAQSMDSGARLKETFEQVIVPGKFVPKNVRGSLAGQQNWRGSDIKRGCRWLAPARP